MLCQVSVNNACPQCDPCCDGVHVAHVQYVQVPLFIKEGETIRVDTRTGEYVGRT